MSDFVKARRRYDSRRRRQQAERTRQEMLEAARRLMLSRGYAGTTIGAIADAAGVSPETIYKSFGGKAGLVRAIWVQSLEGAGPVPAEERSDAIRATERDPRRLIRAWGGFVAEVASRVAPIVLLIRAAAGSDAKMAELLAEVDEQRLRRMEANARTLYERGDLRRELTLVDARDVLWTYSAPELYELLVVRRGWSAERFGRFVAEQMTAALLPPELGA
ncbi:MAG TPA: helix-turn-helix domain-containing protein [Candidatus Limnocylindrales bacterium]|nr:helix-turn-helix domain-containing protein [Candidatus Limnocylindrales bacterium]